jgi:hypothetical protein
MAADMGVPSIRDLAMAYMARRNPMFEWLIARGLIAPPWPQEPPRCGICGAASDETRIERCQGACNP